MAYNLLDLTTNIQDDLKDPSFSATRIKRYLNHGQNVVFGTHLFKFCQAFYNSTLTIGDKTIAPQATQQAFIGFTLVNPSNTSQFAVFNRKNYLEPDVFFDQNPYVASVTAQMPSVWTEYGGTVYLSCPVDKAYIIQQRHYRFPTAMTDNNSVPDVPEAYRELLELWADYRSEKYRGNHDVAATYKQEFEDELENMALRYATGPIDGPVDIASERTRLYD